ncbi:hypothetical protein ACFLS4_03305 [Bacteroidota bacterium]
MRNIVVQLLAVILLLSCANSIYSQKKHKGMRAEDSFTGIIKDTSKIVKIIIIHGTGCKTRTYSHTLIKNLSDELYLSKDNGYKESVAEFYFDSISIEVREFVSSIPSKQSYHFYSIHWSKLTALQKLDLLNEDRPTASRGWISRIVKENILIEQLADFLLYNNDYIKDELYEAATIFVRRILFLDYPTKYKDIALGKEDSPEDLELKPEVDISVNINKLHMITGSLGSSILYDIYNRCSDGDPWSTYLSDAIYSPEEYDQNFIEQMYIACSDEKSMYNMLGDIVIPTGMIFAHKDIVHYALTNQFNLIGLQSQSYLNFSNETKFLFKKLELIAFGDPSDVLSYYVPPYKFESSGKVDVTNVSFKVKGFFQFFSKAHTNPFYDKKLHKTIVNGHEVKKKENKEIRGCSDYDSKKCKKRESGKSKKRLPCTCWEEEYYK